MLFGALQQPLMAIAPPLRPPPALFTVANKPKKVVAVKRRRVEDSE